MKEILERNGFTYHGFCSICGGQAELFKKGAIECKIKSRKMEFTLIVNNKKIKGHARDLETSLQKYISS